MPRSQVESEEIYYEEFPPRSRLDLQNQNHSYQLIFALLSRFFAIETKTKIYPSSIITNYFGRNKNKSVLLKRQLLSAKKSKSSCLSFSLEQ